MENERLFIVGDIHGCLRTLKDLLKKIDWHPERDGLVFIGDYVDRGSDSKGVVDLLIELSTESARVRFLMGNHEDLFLNYLHGGDPDLYFFNGGGATLRSYGIHERATIPHEHISFLQSLELYIELDDYWIVHAGMRPGIEIHEQSPRDLLWIREPFLMSDYDFGKTVIFGHTPFSAPFVTDNKIGLDTGAVFGNRLTCLELPAGKFHSVSAS
jgi:serine/threonine protein phosphatase 1